MKSRKWTRCLVSILAGLSLTGVLSIAAAPRAATLRLFNRGLFNRDQHRHSHVRRSPQRNQRVTCAGVDDTQAILAVISAKQGPLIIGKSQVCAASDITIPDLTIEAGGLLKPLTSHTITLSRGFVAGAYQTFTNASPGQGKISFAGNKSVSSVNVIWWGGMPAPRPDQAADDTAAIQAAFASGASKIVIPDGHYMIDGANAQPGYKRRGLNLVSDTEVIMSTNTFLHLKNNSVVGYNVIVGWNVSNVIVRGGNLVGDNQSNSRQPAENPSGYGLALYGVTNVSIYDVTSQDMYADGFFICYDDDDNSKLRLESENVHLINCIAFRNYRQGLSIIGVKNATIEGGKYYGTRGSPPEDGIDIEPNPGIHGPQTGSIATNIKIIGVTTTDNAGCGIELVGARGSLSNIDILNSQISSNESQGLVYSGATTGTVANNTVTNNARNGISVYHSSDVEVTNNVASQNRQSGIIIQNPAGNPTHHIKVTHNTTSHNDGDGIAVIGFSGKTVSDLVINTNTSSENGANGVVLSFAINVSVDENIVFANSKTSDEAADNIMLTNSDNCSVSNNWIRRGNNEKQPRYGVNLASGTGNSVRNNDLVGAGKTHPINDGATGSVFSGNKLTAPNGPRSRMVRGYRRKFVLSNRA